MATSSVPIMGTLRSYPYQRPLSFESGVICMQRAWVASPDYRRAIDRIRAARETAGLSQREVARRLGKPVSFVNKIELLERRLDIVEFVVLARALGIDPHILLDNVLPAVSDTPEF